jgi:hypothetical protein
MLGRPPLRGGVMLLRYGCLVSKALRNVHGLARGTYHPGDFGEVLWYRCYGIASSIPRPSIY